MPSAANLISYGHLEPTVQRLKRLAGARVPRTLSFSCKSSKKHSFIAAGSSIEYAETKHGTTSSRKMATSGEGDLVIGDFKLRVVARGSDFRRLDPKFLFHLSPFLSFSIDD